LLRIAQEAVHNARRHAHARVISIDLGFRANHVVLRVRDDGCGFLMNAETRPGFGLISMRERAARIGGRLTVASQLGQGTLITAIVPYATYAVM